MPRGGARPNAGRKPGIRSARTVDRLRKVAQLQAVLNDTIPRVFQGDAHAFLTAVYKNEDLDLKMRLDAATAAIGYEKPKLAAVQHHDQDGNSIGYRNTIEVVIVDPAKSGGSARVPAIIDASPL